MPLQHIIMGAPIIIIMRPTRLIIRLLCNTMKSEIDKFRIISESSLRFLYASIAFHEALSDESKVKFLNRNPDYWRLFEASMLSNVFLSVRRLYENKHDSFNVQKLISVFIQNIDDFSLESVKRRKIANGALSSIQAEKYIEGKYEPNEDDFKNMAKYIRERSKRMKGVYTNVASKVYAHAIHFSHSEVLKPNQSLNLYEIEKALLSIWHVYEQVWQLYENGRRPELCEPSYQYKNEVIESVIAQIA